MNTMSPRKSFTFELATKWKRSWLTPIRQPRFVKDKGLLAEQPKRDFRIKLPTSEEHDSLREGCAPSCSALAINHFSL